MFDDPLFLRLQRGLEPTRRALALEQRVRELVADLAMLVDAPRTFDPSASTRLFRISAPEFVSVTVGSRVFKALLDLAPACRLQIVHLSDDEAREQLRRSSLDLAIGRFVSAEGSPFKRQHFYDDEFCVVARQGNVLAPQRMSAAAYQRLVHVFAEADSEISRNDSSTDMDGLKFMVVPHWLTALAIVADSDFIATCPRRLAESQKDTLGLKIYPLPFEAEQIRVSMLTLQDSRDPATKWLSELLQTSVDQAAVKVSAPRAKKRIRL